MNFRPKAPTPMNTTDRFKVTADGSVILGTLDTTGPLMQPRMSHDSGSTKYLSPAAKVDGNNRVVRITEYLLPPIQTTVAVIAQYQGRVPRGAMEPNKRFPFKLKAVGFVNPVRILRGERGKFVSDIVEVTP